MPAAASRQMAFHLVDLVDGLRVQSGIHAGVAQHPVGHFPRSRVADTRKHRTVAAEFAVGTQRVDVALLL
jgi:hypothetical protein